MSPHFTLAELMASDYAARYGLPNTPTPTIVANLQKLAQGLELIRVVLKAPMFITSGFRSPSVNRLVGGSKGSAHMLGWAADFKCPGFGTPLEVCRAIQASPIVFDQLIWEYGSWVHVSFDPRLRRECLSILDRQHGYFDDFPKETA